MIEKYLGGFLNYVQEIYELEMPEINSLEEGVDKIHPLVKGYSEEGFASGKFLEVRWAEIHDTDNVHEAVFHLFREGGEYMVVVDGNISKGTWKTIGKSLNLEYGGKNELFEFLYLDDEFFIMQKHGNQARKGMKKYVIYGVEGKSAALDWRNYMQKWYDLYRNSTSLQRNILIVVIIIILFVVFSFDSIF